MITSGTRIKSDIGVRAMEHTHSINQSKTKKDQGSLARFIMIFYNQVSVCNIIKVSERQGDIETMSGSNRKRVHGSKEISSPIMHHPLPPHMPCMSTTLPHCENPLNPLIYPSRKDLGTSIKYDLECL